jgi:tRNA/tmRNA/rRNA uracil-C5-methylase (TrmA/RlmC/RlmD family)
MTQTTSKTKVEYGDFQTPLELAERICDKLVELGVNPNIIIEPTCGIGNFVQASTYSFPLVSQIIGLEINHTYLQEIQKNNQPSQDERIQIQQGNFFEFDWSSLINNQN